MNESADTSFYDDVFEKAAPKQRAAFLTQLFAKDSDLRHQFQNFIEAWQSKEHEKKGEVPTLSFVDLHEIQEEVRELLSEMNFYHEDVYDYFDQGGRSYVPEWEAAYEGAQNMLREEVFEPYGNQAI